MQLEEQFMTIYQKMQNRTGIIIKKNLYSLKQGFFYWIMFVYQEIFS